MTKLNQHRPIPSRVTSPVYHNSGTMKSTPAGGELDRSSYMGKQHSADTPSGAKPAPANAVSPMPPGTRWP